MLSTSSLFRRRLTSALGQEGDTQTDDMATPTPPLLRGLTAAVTRVVCCALVVLPCIYVSSRHAHDNWRRTAEDDFPGGPLRAAQTSLQAVNRSAPEQMELSGQNLIIERVQQPKGVLLTFHGCSHSALDWWQPGPTCKACTGLPEETAIVRAAVARQYVVVAISSADQAGSRCWDVAPPPQQTVDVKHTVASIKALSQAEQWGDLPIYALGASSGGAMVALLPFFAELQGICVQIMGVPPSVYQDLNTAAARPFPPTMFVHMPRDKRTAAAVAADVEALKAQGVATLEVKHEPVPLSGTFFSARIEDVSVQLSGQIFRAFKDGGLLDGKGLLKADPRMTVDKWQAVLRDQVPEAHNMSLEADRSPIFEVLNVAWAGHEIISDTTDAMLDWFAAQRSATA